MFTKFQLVAFASPQTHQVQLLGFFFFSISTKESLCVCKRKFPQSPFLYSSSSTFFFHIIQLYNS